MADTPVTPTPIGSWPTPPQRTDAPATFVTRADAWVAATPTRSTEMNALADNVKYNADSAFDSAGEAEASAVLATSAANAEVWVSGQAYVLGEASISTIDFQAYRANTATSGTTDPSLSGDWTIVTVGTPPGGSMIYISTVTASASSTVDIEGFDSTYERYVIECDDLLLASIGELRGQVKISGSYVTTSTYSSGRQIIDSSSTAYSGSALTSSTGIYIGGLYDPAAEGSLDIRISKPSGTSSPKVISSVGLGMRTSTRTVLSSAGGANSGTGAVTGLRILENTGIAITGTFKLYGIKNS